MTSATAPTLIHQALVYDSDDAFLAATTGFCLDGLATGDHVLAVTTEANIELLRGALDGAADEVEYVVADDWYNAPGRTLAAYHRYVNAHKGDDRRVRVIGEPVWQGRNAVEEAEWTRYESVINIAFADCPAWIVCPYDTRVLPGRVVADARRTHPDVLTGPNGGPSHAYTEPVAFAQAADARPLPSAPTGVDMTIRFDADLARMRQQVADRAVALGLSSEQVGRLLLAVNEVATNAVQHGGGHGEIRLWAEGTTVACDVIDPGLMDTSFPGYLPPDPGAERGHGLWVVRQLCDLMEVRTGLPGTQIRLHLSRL